jgi:integrase
MKGGEGERRLTFRGLARFLTWCGKQRLVENNICDEFDRDERPRSAPGRDHVPTIDELRAIWSAVENEPQRDLVRFLLLVPLRRAEAAGLAWSEVKWPARRIRIAARRAKTRELQELPLSPPALELLKARRIAEKGELVFPAGEGKPYNGFPRLLKRIRARIGNSEAVKAERFVLHDIRRSFVTLLAEHGYDVDLLDQILGHSRKGVLAVYQRARRMAEREQALNTWADLMTGEERESQRMVKFRKQER